MRLGIAIGFGWVCGSFATQWLEFPWTWAFAALAGLAFGGTVALVDHHTGSERDS